MDQLQHWTVVPTDTSMASLMRRLFVKGFWRKRDEPSYDVQKLGNEAVDPIERLATCRATLKTAE